jgi:hypothetical protein
MFCFISLDFMAQYKLTSVQKEEKCSWYYRVYLAISIMTLAQSC